MVEWNLDLNDLVLMVKQSFTEDERMINYEKEKQVYAYYSS